jgi:FkbM family methyltransferase
MSKWGYRLRKLRKHPRPLRFIVGRLLWLSGLSPLFVVEMPRGFRMRFYRSSISAALWSDPTSRSEDEDFVWTVLRPGDRYVDAGANVGQLVLAASRRVGPGGEVIAIEAHPKVFTYLAGNVALNDVHNVRLHHCALGAGSGEVALTSRRSDDQNYVAEGGPVRVPMLALDDLLPAGRPARLLKLDVEGYELPVLQGAQRALDQTQVVYCELSAGNCKRYGYEPHEVEKLLLANGFVFLRRTGDELGVTNSPYFSTLPAESLPATGYNLVAARPEVAEEVRGRLAAVGWLPT